jgi:hypothetical protein
MQHFQEAGSAATLLEVFVDRGEIRQKTGVTQAPMPASAAVACRLEQTHSPAPSLEMIATR